MLAGFEGWGLHNSLFMKPESVTAAAAEGAAPRGRHRLKVIELSSARGKFDVQQDLVSRVNGADLIKLDLGSTMGRGKQAPLRWLRRRLGRFKRVLKQCARRACELQSPTSPALPGVQWDDCRDGVWGLWRRVSPIG